MLLTGLNRNNLDNTYALSTNDIPHRLVGVWSWAPPIGKGKKFDPNNRVLNMVAGGWISAA